MVWKFAFNYEIKEGKGGERKGEGRAGERARDGGEIDEKEMFHVGLGRLSAKIALFRRPLIANGLFLPLPLSTSSSSSSSSSSPRFHAAT